MSRDTILSAIRCNTQATKKIPLPESTRYPLPATLSPQKAFAEAVRSVGGECIDIRDLTPSSQRSMLNAQRLQNYFDGREPQILRAHFGVIENGACWIEHHPEDERTRYTLPEHIAILLPHEALVPTMHEAYDRIAELGIDDFGLLLSGPSKTADIEQALVIGAQGAVSTKIFLV
jgi:L-lactate dehydrogenase complex protein LldG